MLTGGFSHFIAIGAAGEEGLSDIIEILGALPSPLAAVVLVVLSRPLTKAGDLRDILSRNSPMPVFIAEDDEVFQPNHCYIGQPNAHLVIAGRDRAGLIRGTHDELFGRTVDTLFQSVAFHAGRFSIGVVLSGAYDDGSRGLAKIHEAHGLTMVLEPGSKSRGMQQNAIEYDGPIDYVGTAIELGEIIGQVVSAGARIGYA